jgi:hypothetical protein
LLAEFSLDYVDLPGGTRTGWMEMILRTLKLPDEPPQLDLF